MGKEFHGDVGQVVMGDAKTGPALHNVMNVNVSSAPEAKPVEFKALNMFQRAKIKDRVKAVSASTGMADLEVYRHILAEFGADNLNSLSADTYKDVIAYLAGLAGNHLPDEPSEQPATQEAPLPCPVCVEHKHSVKKLRIGLSILAMFSLFCLCGVVWAVVQSNKADTPASIAATDEYCHQDGKSFSVGSIVKMPDNNLMKCTNAPGASPNYWEQIKTPSIKPVTKRRHQEPSKW
ncbi:hypothetical protein [Undibacterium luofuense]|uniref:Uncharacterized protein n=1 Tax=Undibacterium luofuense TaxID=2828733 RepID=A0A941I7H8_9BURK|nr:hypothetical protein [Undibacterium luofuense]MBR7782680.1 hypothetical protein [Undibacterium luofuense]